MKRFLSLFAILATSLTVVACGGNDQQAQAPAQNQPQTPAASNQAALPPVTDNVTVADSNVDLSDFAIGMITDQGGINDQSFNQSAWEGLQRLQASTGAGISNMESANEAAIGPNLDMMIDLDKDIIWTIGFLTEVPLSQAAAINPQQMYGIIDFDFGADTPNNIINVVFRENEASFLAGYMAARTSETGQIGFIGGMQGLVIDRFEFGFRAGAEYAAAVHGFDIDVAVQYVGNFFDDAAARAIATTMYANGADIIFAAAGGAGQGVIDTAIDMNRFVIGVDRDQRDLAPNNMITSVMKFVGEAIYDVSQRVANLENLGGTTLVYGLAEEGVGLTPFDGGTAELVEREVFDATMEVSDRIINGEVSVPANEAEFNDFMNTL